MRQAALLLGLVYLAASAGAQTPDRKPAAEPATPAAGAAGRAGAAVAPAVSRPAGANLLRVRFPSVDLSDVTLRETFEWLAKVTQTNVVVRWDMLAEAGVEDDATVSIRARNLRLGQILWMVLNQVAPDGERLAYRISRDMILISSEDDLRQEMITRVYDVTDIASVELATPQFAAGRNHDIPQITGVGVAPGAVGAEVNVVRVFSGVHARSSNPTGVNDEDYDAGDGGFAERMQQLADVITATVEPETWDVNGGNGTIRIHRGLLVVRNSPFVHQLIGGPIEE